MTLQLVSPGRYQIFKGVSKSDLEKVVKDNKVNTLQFSEPLSDTEIKNLESIVFSKRPDITLRVFGHYGLICDLTFLEKIPSAQNIFADCLQNAVGVEVLTKFNKLEKIAIGIFNLDNFDFLNYISPTIKELSLEQTSSKKPSIQVIERFKDLTYLYLEDQQKGIEALNKLTKLEKVVLRSITTKDVSYLEGLEKLWSIDIKLGGIKNFDSLTKVKNLKYLELWQIRGLSDLSFISDINSLQNLFIQSLKQVTNLPRFDSLRNLRRLYLENLKGLVNLTTLEFAPSLTDLIYVLAENQEPENLIPVLRNKNVKSVFCRFGSAKKNNTFEKLAKQYGKQKYSYSDFKYQ